MNYLMKAQFVLFALFILACSKQDLPEPGPPIGEIENGNGISEEELERYTGEIGLLIDVREVAKLGYHPAEVSIDVNAQEGNYDQVLSVDPFTSMAQLSISIENLSEAAETELREGIPFIINILDNQGNTIVSTQFDKTSWKENGTLVKPDIAGLEEQFTAISFRENTPHYLQVYYPETDFFWGNVAFVPTNAGDANSKVYGWYEGDFDFAPYKTYAQFYFQPWPLDENVYAIYAAHTSRYLAIDDNDGSLRQSGAYSYMENIETLHPRYLFRIARGEDGAYTISSMNGLPLRKREQDWTTMSSSDIAHFRIIALDINWQVEILSTKQLEPILPAAETSFGFNSTLINCGSGDLQQEVGVERTETTSYTTSFEETIGLAGRVTSTTSASVTASAEAEYFGSSASVSGTVSTELEVSVEANQSSSIGQESTTEQTDTYFSRRIVSVPAGKASLVYDAYQTYSNVRIPFVQRVRITGRLQDTNEALTGMEIASQYSVASGKGVISDIGATYIEITIRGYTVLDNILKTKSEVQDVPSGC